MGRNVSTSVVRTRVLAFVTVVMLVLGGVGCSTSGQFRIPQGTTLSVEGRTVTPNESGKWGTRPFSWGAAGGANYVLKDQNGNIVRRGKLRTKFRIASIFFPPFAIAYWPMGLGYEYDLTGPADGYLIRDDASVANNPPSAAPGSNLPPVDNTAPAAPSAERR